MKKENLNKMFKTKEIKYFIFNDFIVEIETDITNNTYEIYLNNPNYCFKYYMFGLLKEHEENLFDIIINNLDEYISIYKDRFMNGE